MNETDDLKDAMDNAISAYIAHCTNISASDVDYSFINQDIDDAIQMLKQELTV